MDIYVGDIFTPPGPEPMMDIYLGPIDLEAAIGNISVGTVEGPSEKVSAAEAEPIPDPLEDAARYERRRPVLGRFQSLLTGGLGALGTPPVMRTSLLGRRL